MPKRIDYTLTTEQLKTIEIAIKKHSGIRVRERARIIRLLHLGHKRSDVAHLLAISVGKVHYWYNRWNQIGLAGLVDEPRSGRPRVTDQAYRELLQQTLEQDPQQLGFAFTVWSVTQLQLYMCQQTGVKVHDNTVRNLLQEMEYVYRRPKHDLNGLHDEATRERATEVIELLKKKPKTEKLTYSLWTKQP